MRLLLICALQSVAGGAVWTLAYEGRSTNDIIRDKRMVSLVNTRVPARLSRELLEALGGPPDPVFVRDQRYVSMSACVAHACLTKGFFWIDVKTGAGLGAVALAWEHMGAHSLRLGSNGMPPTRIPQAARDALIDWLSDEELTPERVDFIGGQGESSSLDASVFKPRLRAPR